MNIAAERISERLAELSKTAPKPEPDRAMTDEYSALSMLAAFKSAGCDEYFGTTLFRAFLRRHVWGLTNELMDGMCAIAKEFGMPDAALHLEAAEQLVNNRLLMDVAKKLQQEVDVKHGIRRKP